jgi:osmotically-inducible protein OsmY
MTATNRSTPVRAAIRKSCVLVVLALMLTSCTRRTDPASAPDPAADARVAESVRARLAAEPSLASGSIRVEVDAGYVRLYGSVNGIGAWQCAIRSASLQPGVAGVADQLVIQRGPREVHCVAPRG